MAGKWVSKSVNQRAASAHVTNWKREHSLNCNLVTLYKDLKTKPTWAIMSNIKPYKYHVECVWLVAASPGTVRGWGWVRLYT